MPRARPVLAGQRAQHGGAARVQADHRDPIRVDVVARRQRLEDVRQEPSPRAIQWWPRRPAPAPTRLHASANRSQTTRTSERRTPRSSRTTRFLTGAPASEVLPRLEAAAGKTDAPFAHAYVAHVTARTGAELLAVSEVLEVIGSLQLACDVAAKAANTFHQEGRQDSARRAAAHAQALYREGRRAGRRLIPAGHST